jgi:hypothetical protein
LLSIQIESKEFASKPISAETSKEGWTEVTVDLSSFAGKSVLVELIAAGGAAGALWAEVNAK